MSTKTKRALISVSDKHAIVEFARSLQEKGVEIISTGGTAKELASHGIAVLQVAEVTGFPEIMGGRVKTLHPKIHGGILARRDTDTEVMDAHAITAIDMVVVNLYPFRETIAQADCTLADAIENIDIGGPAMIRSSAKNHRDVIVVTDPEDYQMVLQALDDNLDLPADKRFALAQKAFAHTAGYDLAISDYFATVQQPPAAPAFVDTLNLRFHKQSDLRYGENPHQSAAFYRESAVNTDSIACSRQIQGKELSFNNIADADAALECVKQFEATACVIVKHANPCGVAAAASLSQCYELAYRTDPVSAFGGIIAFNEALDADTASLIVERQFAEVIVAPSVDKAAQDVLATKPNIRVLEYAGSLSSQAENSQDIVQAAATHDYRRINGGLLVQDSDSLRVSEADLTIATTQAPTAKQIEDLLFAWKVVKYVKSNAIVFCENQATVGVGAGQMSRVYSARIAAIKARDANLTVAGTVLASDAFFPFRDTIDQAAEYGVSAIIQPGGSMRDAEVVDAANEHGIAMVFTGARHFRH
ncbi:bifunctional phosphoribosylaminoimidazolecarboxamide formyltransferase/IMP cyclohydrolase [Chromatiales bacterium (ex Bugula neritina AB1)]|nr:bifunctional phosphoribosylaminoimidazolecarboxamide formyltransferase/IMP cyclohydrolase [Chromatiales bacterium (ex Bugula neritina AB1)]